MNKIFTLDLDTPATEVPMERRHEQCFPLDNRGEIRVIDKDGRLVGEEVILEDWSDVGCRFQTGMRLQAGEIVAIRPLEKDEQDSDGIEPHLFEIMWTNRRIAFWVAGAIKLQGEKLAATKFPPADHTPGRSST